MKVTLLAALGNIYLWVTMTLLQIITPVHNFIQKYLFQDLGFLKWLVIAMILDLVTGVAKVYKQQGLRGITSKGLRDTVSKCIQYGAFLIITHIITHYEIGGYAATNMRWINKLAMEFILLVECKSVYENIVTINPKFDFVAKLWDKITELYPSKKKENSV
jgi:Bacteriophage holin family